MAVSRTSSDFLTVISLSFPTQIFINELTVSDWWCQRITASVRCGHSLVLTQTQPINSTSNIGVQEPLVLVTKRNVKIRLDNLMKIHGSISTEEKKTFKVEV